MEQDVENFGRFCEWDDRQAVFWSVWWSSAGCGRENICSKNGEAWASVAFDIRYSVPSEEQRMISAYGQSMPDGVVLLVIVDAINQERCSATQALVNADVN